MLYLLIEQAFIISVKFIGGSKKISLSFQEQTCEICDILYAWWATQSWLATSFSMQVAGRTSDSMTVPMGGSGLKTL